MAITFVKELGEGGTINSQSYSSSALTSVPNELYLVAVAGHHTTIGSVTCSVIHEAATNPLNFVLIASCSYNTIASPTETVCLFRAMKPNASDAGVLRFRWGLTESNCVWSVVRFAGVPTTGVDGADAVGTFNSGAADTVASTDVSLSAVGTNNASYGMFQIPLASSTGLTTGSTAYTQIDQIPGQPIAEAEDLLIEWALPGQTSVPVSSSGGTARNMGGISVEIIAAGGPSSFLWSFTPQGAGGSFISLSPVPGAGAPISFKVF